MSGKAGRWRNAFSRWLATVRSKRESYVGWWIDSGRQPTQTDALAAVAAQPGSAGIFLHGHGVDVLPARLAGFIDGQPTPSPNHRHGHHAGICAGGAIAQSRDECLGEAWLHRRATGRGGREEIR